MCIIVIKPKGIKLPSKDIFINCWNKNHTVQGSCLMIMVKLL